MMYTFTESRQRVPKGAALTYWLVIYQRVTNTHFIDSIRRFIKPKPSIAHVLWTEDVRYQEVFFKIAELTEHKIRPSGVVDKISKCI